MLEGLLSASLAVGIALAPAARRTTNERIEVNFMVVGIC